MSISNDFQFDHSSSADSNKNDSFWSTTRMSNDSNGAVGDDDELTMNFENINLLNESGSNTNGSSKNQSDIDQKDSIAEPLYALMGEIFDMGGVFKWLRRSLISFVQITYGRTINRCVKIIIKLETEVHIIIYTISDKYENQ